MIIQRLYAKIKKKQWDRQHLKVMEEHRKEFAGKQPTIICCNCIGGVLYHELGLKFTSPTINLYMKSEDFIKFCENLEYYLSLEITDYRGNIERDYPLGMLGDILIFFVHYSTLEAASQKWNERKQRMDWNNIYIIAMDRDGFTMDHLRRFEKLPYKNKKLFSHIPFEGHNDVVYIKGYENEEQLEGLVYRTKGGHFLIDQFDWVGWLNGEK